MIKVGLLGFGFMGGAHFKVYQNLPDVKVVGIYDLDPGKVKKDELTAGNIGDSSAKLDFNGIKITDNAEELINSNEIDMIDICLSTYLHPEYSIKALNAGKNVLCEKPMALTVKDCDDMIKAAKKSKKKFMIAQCIRFWPEYVFAKQAIQNKRYGSVLNVFARRVSPTPIWSCKNWILDEKKGGGALLDLHIHDIDYIVYLLGKPKQVYSSGLKNVAGKKSGVDYVITQYIYNNKFVIIAEGGWHYQSKFPFNMSFTIRCEKATLSFDGIKPLIVYKEDGTVENPEISKSTGYDEEIKYFIDCVINNKEIKVSTPEQSKLAVKIALAEKQSIKKNKPVKV